MRFHVVIPARYGSTRLPGKPLALLGGVPMVVQVMRRAAAAGAASVLVATDDARVVAAVTEHGGTALLTRPDHPSGTDRIHEVAEARGWDEDELVVNLQGDEPLMPPSLLRQVAELLVGDPEAGLATLCTPLTNTTELHDPNVVKVVFDARGRALYFSRAPIPWDRDAAGAGSRGAHRHLGLYAYRVATLARLTASPPCELEQVEKLEQLRAQWLGIGIAIDVARVLPGPGVDTPGDLARVSALL
jgi:3-deoxy-manno-octulosonate cytidylyltransferase (CMP-KDO synthetase)